MPRKSDADWFPVAMQFWQLWADASTVIWLRSMRMMQGGAIADREAKRMVTEKVKANSDLAFMLATDQPGTPQATTSKAIQHYQTRVSANRRRLSRPTKR